MAKSPFKMNGFSGFGNSPAKQDETVNPRHTFNKKYEEYSKKESDAQRALNDAYLKTGKVDPKLKKEYEEAYNLQSQYRKYMKKARKISANKAK